MARVHDLPPLSLPLPVAHFPVLPSAPFDSFSDLCFQETDSHTFLHGFASTGGNSIFPTDLSFEWTRVETVLPPPWFSFSLTCKHCLPCHGFRMIGTFFRKNRPSCPKPSALGQMRRSHEISPLFLFPFFFFTWMLGLGLRFYVPTYVFFSPGRPSGVETPFFEGERVCLFRSLHSFAH